MRKFLSAAIPITITITSFILLNFVFLLGAVPSPSMEPTIHEKSFIVGLRNPSTIEKGDVVIFEKDGEMLVKRVAGVAGDTVINNGEEVVVPENSYYMLGDNSNNSFDSRYWEEPFVPEEDILARVILPSCEIKAVASSTDGE